MNDDVVSKPGNFGMATKPWAFACPICVVLSVFGIVGFLDIVTRILAVGMSSLLIDC